MHRQSFDSQPHPWREPMDKLDRRSALAFGLIAASAAVVKPAASQPMEDGKETTLAPGVVQRVYGQGPDRKSTRLNSSHGYISYAVFCLKKKKKKTINGVGTTKLFPARQSL